MKNCTYNQIVSGKLGFAVLLILSLISINAAATRIVIPAPDPTGTFGTDVKVLPNGNVVVTDPGYDITSPQTVADVGAVYLYNGMTGSLISALIGNCRFDNIGIDGIKVLANGNFTVSSRNFDLISPSGTSSNTCAGGIRQVMPDAGAVTLVNGTTGLNEVVSSTNSLTGSFGNELVSNVFPLPNGNYLVASIFSNNNRGAVAWRNGNITSGATFSETNSLIGSSPSDYIGKVKILTNGNYIVHSSNWNNNRGAVSLCSSPTGCIGVISQSNSLIGNPGDLVGFNGITELKNGNFVVKSTLWNGQRGAVSFVNAANGTSGVVSSGNSLVGSQTNDFVGTGDVVPLSNGNYVVGSPSWKVGTSDVGAATFGNGTTGVSGTISSANSLTGNQGSDFYLSEIIPLTNGNYVINLPRTTIPGTPNSGAAIWSNGISGITGTVSASNSLHRGCDGGVVALANGNYVVISPSALGTGAVTFGNGTTGVTGLVSAENSLVGSSNGDRIGFGGGSGAVTALTNGNYVVNSPSWDNGSIQDAGASTFCGGTAGCFGVVSTLNSLVGTRSFDQIGYGGAKALANGNYVVKNDLWDNVSATNAGAITWGNGTNGVTGEVSASNSLVGTNTGDQVGIGGIVALPNGNYVIGSFGWNNRGAVTWGNGAIGITGTISAFNSIIGSNIDDRVGDLGSDNSVKIFTDSSYVFLSASWNNGSIQDAGAVTLGKANSPIIGEITDDNSVRGTVAAQGANLVYDYNPANKILAVGSYNSRTLTIFRNQTTVSPLDFDGDGKTDISIFRPSAGEWWINRSSNNQTFAAQFGSQTDKIVPADFTGDGKTDIAVWRPSSGFWFVLRSEDNSFYSFPFGTSGDTPIVGDFDADGKADTGVFRASNLTWFISKSSGGTIIQQFGAVGDKPVASDYDGDGKADIAIFRPNGANGAEWWIQRSSNNSVFAATFGSSTDNPVQGDYTGDGKTDIAVWRPANGNWFILRSEDFSFYAFPFGANGDLPVAGDYDGDGKVDAGVFRPSNSTWFVNRSTAGTLIQQFGIAGDLPTPNAFVP